MIASFDKVTEEVTQGTRLIHTESERLPSTVADRKGGTGELYDARYRTTQRGLKSRHAQMIALGGTIGSGLFVGTGQTLSRGGPALILVAYLIVTLAVYCVVTALTEVAAWLPVHGSSVSLFAHRYVSRSLGFALGWLYWYSLGILVPYEITAAGLVIDYCDPPVNIAVWLSIMIVVIIALNLLPVSYYGEAEFWFASLKVFMLFGLLILSFILFWGGAPYQDGILGFRYWKDSRYGGAVHTYLEQGNTGHFIAFLSTLVLAAFPFAFAPEMIVVTGGEMESPRRNLPKASRRYFYRLIIFYVGSVFAIGIICPSNSSALTSGGVGAGSSAFVVGITNAGIPVLSSIINAVIITSAWSSGNSFLYLSSRSLYSLAVTGNAPAIFKTCSASGVPYLAVACSSLFCLLAYLNVANSGALVFTWFVNLTNTSAFTSWVCCCIVYLRFRAACRAQDITNLPYHSRLQPYGAWFAIAFFTFLTLVNGFDCFWPRNWSASSFLTAYVGIPVFLVIYLGHRVVFWKEKWAYTPGSIDLRTGMREVEGAETPAPVYDKWYQHLRKVFE